MEVTVNFKVNVTNVNDMSILKNNCHNVLIIKSKLKIPLDTFEV